MTAPLGTTVTPTFETALLGFISAAQTKVDAGNANYPGQSAVLEVDEGSKFLRIVKVQWYNGEPSDGRSAYCFIEKATGLVYKAASWKSPERRNPRSSIFSPDFGASGVTEYGAIYLR